MADAAPADTTSATQNPSPNGTSGAAATSKDISTSWTDPNYKPPAGYLGNLSANQQKALDQFRKELQDEGLFVEEEHVLPSNDIYDRHIITSRIDV